MHRLREVAGQLTGEAAVVALVRAIAGTDEAAGAAARLQAGAASYGRGGRARGQVASQSPSAAVGACSGGGAVQGSEEQGREECETPPGALRRRCGSVPYRLLSRSSPRRPPLGEAPVAAHCSGQSC